MADLGDPYLAGDAWSSDLGGSVQPEAPKFHVGETVKLDDRPVLIKERSLRDGGKWMYLVPVGWVWEKGLAHMDEPDMPVKITEARTPLTQLIDTLATALESDPVNHPSHYKVGGFEAIDVLEAFFPEDPLLWQVGKYLLRAGRKDPAKTAEDLEKARWYLTRKIDQLKEGRGRDDEGA